MTGHVYTRQAVLWAYGHLPAACPPAPHQLLLAYLPLALLSSPHLLLPQPLQAALPPALGSPTRARKETLRVHHMPCTPVTGNIQGRVS